MCVFFFVSPEIWNTKHPKCNTEQKLKHHKNFASGVRLNIDVIMTLKSERNIFQMLRRIIQSFDCKGHYHMWGNHLLELSSLFTCVFKLIQVFVILNLLSWHPVMDVRYMGMYGKIYWFHTQPFIYDLILPHNNPGLAHKLQEGLSVHNHLYFSLMIRYYPVFPNTDL